MVPNYMQYVDSEKKALFFRKYRYCPLCGWVPGLTFGKVDKYQSNFNVTCAPGRPAKLNCPYCEDKIGELSENMVFHFFGKEYRIGDSYSNPYVSGTVVDCEFPLGPHSHLVVLKEDGHREIIILEKYHIGGAVTPESRFWAESVPG